MEEMYCQSCGMPLTKKEDIATNKDGSLMNEYCIYCFKDGAFTGDISMEGMIDISLKHMKEIFKDDPGFNEQEALIKMRGFFPELKRWKSKE
ncbi:MAG: zinc ribbon domain-containing protein [Bacteroides intestinalis]|nr:zinc ribbon domain-containing protein [Bacteroides intestinalis]